MKNLLTNPLVSICIPTYNGDRFIAATIQSVLEQTYRPLEIVISDDHSSDRTLEIVHSLLDHQSIGNPDLQVKILCHERLGLAKNWNYCLQSASGTYLKFLFQDDLLRPECVEEMVKLALQDDQIGLVFCQREIICEDGLSFDPLYGKDLTSHWHQLQAIQSGLNLLLDPNLLQEPLNKIGEPSNVLLAKWAIAQVGNFDPSLVQVLDWDMWLRFMAYGKVGYVDRVLVSFRVHSSQVSQDNALSGASWLDNWRLQLKMLSHREYEFLPENLREEILSRCTDQLQNLHQTQQSSSQQIQTLHSDRQAIADQLTDAQNQAQITIQEISLEKEKLEQKLEKTHKEHNQKLKEIYQSHEINTNKLTTEINTLGMQLKETHQNLTELGEEMQSLHRAFLRKEAELNETLEKSNYFQSTVRAMEQSNFWKLRNVWCKLKQKLGFKVEAI